LWIFVANVDGGPRKVSESDFRAWCWLMSSELSFRAWWSLENAVNEFFERGDLRKMVIFSSPVMELSGFF
jgi:hypothetical protein